MNKDIKNPLSKDDALKIANKELKNSYYRENLKDNWIYGLLSFELECEDTIYNGREAYLISVVGGTFSAQRPKDYVSRGNSIFDKMREIYGEFDKESNIKCIVYKDNGEYKYLRKE